MYVRRNLTYPHTYPYTHPFFIIIRIIIKNVQIINITSHLHMYVAMYVATVAGLGSTDHILNLKLKLYPYIATL